MPLHLLLNDNHYSPEPSCLIPNQLISLSKGPLAECAQVRSPRHPHSPRFNTAWAGPRSSSIPQHRVRGFLPSQFSSAMRSLFPLPISKGNNLFYQFLHGALKPFPSLSRCLHRKVRQYSRAALRIHTLLILCGSFQGPQARPCNLKSGKVQ